MAPATLSAPLLPVPTQKPKREKSKIVIRGNRGVKFVRTVTVCRPLREVYDFWRNPENVAQIVEYPIVIRRITDTKSRWQVKLPGKRRFEWDLLVINDHPNSLIAWRSGDGSDIQHAGSIRLKPANKGTRVTVQIEYDPPGGKVMAWLAKVSSTAFANQVTECLRRYKVMTDNIAVSPPPRLRIRRVES